IRSRTRLPPRHLCDVVDSRLDPGIHPAVVEPGENGHHRGAEKAVLQPPPDEEQSRSVRGRRSVARKCREDRDRPRSEEHTSELQSLMRISYAVFCLKKK